MSLFEDDKYQYCDTFFVYFNSQQRPTAETAVKALQSVSDKYELSDVRATNGMLDAMTVRSPQDCSAMDIALVEGEEVTEQVRELMSEFRTMSLDGDDFQKLKKIDKANARLDVFHFERISKDSDQQMLDPGGLFLVLEKLNELCDGVGLDPQSKTLI